MTLVEIPGGGPGRLGFADAGEKAFGFLLDLGFVLVRKETSFLRFESPAVFVNVYHGRQSYQVGLELGRVSDRELYSLYEVVEAVAPAEVATLNLQTRDADGLSQCLGRIASLVRQTFGRLLRNEPRAFAKLAAMVGERRETATLRAQYGAILERADNAWERKEYQVAAEQYAMALPALDETRKRRLEYLRKHPERER